MRHADGYPQAGRALEEVRAEGGHGDAGPLRKVAALAVVPTPTPAAPGAARWTSSSSRARSPPSWPPPPSLSLASRWRATARPPWSAWRSPTGADAGLGGLAKEEVIGQDGCDDLGRHLRPGRLRPAGRDLELRNLRGVVTGRLGAAPVAETLRVEAGRVVSVGAARPTPTWSSTPPGRWPPPAWSTTCHVVFGDYTPRQHAVGFLESYLHGGVTQVMSASEVHLPGRPRDRAGVKALAVAAQRAWSGFRPGGVKVRGGSLICEPVLERGRLRRAGRRGRALHEGRLRRLRRPLRGGAAGRLGQGGRVRGHVPLRGASIPGSSPITVDHLLAMDPTIAGHANGGTTSLPDPTWSGWSTGREWPSRSSRRATRSGLHLLALARDRGRLDRVILGTDTPSGTGVMPLGLLKTVAELASLGGLDPADALALATGNAGRVLGVAEGVLEPGRPADLVLLQEPLGGTRDDPLAALAVGDLPGIAGVVVDGGPVLRSRNTPAPAREATVTGRSAARWPR